MRGKVCVICEKELIMGKKGLQHKGSKQPIHPAIVRVKGKIKKIKNGIGVRDENQ